MKLNPNTIYHCKTHEDAEAFLRDCNEQNIPWCGGGSTTSRFQWNEQQSCYVITDHEGNGRLSLRYGSMGSCQDVFSDFPVITYELTSPEELAARDLAWKQMMGVA